ncbi:hypothetical protein V8F20_006686, partial [Naviculisporaceae sp. PSN 640]
PVHSASSSTKCTNGTRATDPEPTAWPIDYYTLVKPTEKWTSYSIKKDWLNAHYVDGPLHLDIGPGLDPYAAFKFQWICNAATNCSSFFVWHGKETDESSDTGQRQGSDCYLFDSVMTSSVFEPSDGTVVVGAYNRICDDSG